MVVVMMVMMMVMVVMMVAMVVMVVVVARRQGVGGVRGGESHLHRFGISQGGHH
jgi:hypothetical protein